MASLSELISESSAGDGRSPANSISKPNTFGIVPIEGDQLPLPLPATPERRRFWLQVFHRDRYYTYHEFKKEFTLESWDAKCYYTLGRARTARYALRNNKQLRKDFPDAQILIYDADLDRIIDPEPATLPPEPETPKFPLCDNSPDRLPCCPECGALMLAPWNDCPTCEWADPSAIAPKPSPLQPQIDALKQRRSQLMKQIDGIRRAGAIAPQSCWIEAYNVTKKLSNGKKEQFKYYRVKSKADAPFQNKHGQATKSLHLGTESSPAYKDWRDRVQRRNAIAALERNLDKAERKLQTLQSKAATRT